MIRHIVMWKFKGEDREKNAHRAKDMLIRLPERIDVIDSFEIGINFWDEDVAFDLAMTLTFRTRADLRAYRSHPDRIRVIELISKMRKQRVVVDYEI